MKLALVFGAWSLTFRGEFTFVNLWDDPRGLTGSEYGFVRIAEELQKLGHEVDLFTKAAESEWQGMRVHPLEELPNVGPTTMPPSASTSSTSCAGHVRG